MGTHLRVLSESYPMNTNMTGLQWFSKIFASFCGLDESSLSIGSVKTMVVEVAMSQNPTTDNGLSTFPAYDTTSAHNPHKAPFNPSNAKATFIQSTRRQRLLKTV